jgi:hypothetical protein
MLVGFGKLSRYLGEQRKSKGIKSSLVFGHRR